MIPSLETAQPSDPYIRTPCPGGVAFSPQCVIPHPRFERVSVYAMRTCTHFRLLSLPLVLPLMLICR